MTSWSSAYQIEAFTRYRTVWLIEMLPNVAEIHLARSAGWK